MIRQKGGVTFRNVSYGRKCVVLAENDTHILLKCVSGRVWSGVAMTETEPTLYLLAIKLEENEIDVVREMAPGRKWRQAKEELISQMVVSPVPGG